MEAADKYNSKGHPAIDELAAEQGVLFPRDPTDLLGHLWPEEESVEDFLIAVREWRGHIKTDGRMTPVVLDTDGFIPI